MPSADPRRYAAAPPDDPLDAARSLVLALSEAQEIVQQARDEATSVVDEARKELERALRSTGLADPVLALPSMRAILGYGEATAPESPDVVGSTSQVTWSALVSVLAPAITPRVEDEDSPAVPTAPARVAEPADDPSPPSESSLSAGVVEVDDPVLSTEDRTSAARRLGSEILIPMVAMFAFLAIALFLVG